MSRRPGPAVVLRILGDDEEMDQVEEILSGRIILPYLERRAWRWSRTWD